MRLPNTMPLHPGPRIVRADDITADEIAAWVGSGGAVILPTETVYGLAVKPGDPAILERAFNIKGRPPELNLPVVVGSLEQVEDLGVDFNSTARRLARDYWPGPLTLVMGFSPDRQRPGWLGGRVEVAIRYPGYPLLRQVALAGGAFLLTSANGHGAGPKREAAEALASLHQPVDYVVDAGVLSSTPSTIINVRHAPAVIERIGALTARDLQAFIDAGLIAREES